MLQQQAARRGGGTWSSKHSACQPAEHEAPGLPGHRGLQRAEGPSVTSRKCCTSMLFSKSIASRAGLASAVASRSCRPTFAAMPLRAKIIGQQAPISTQAAAKLFAPVEGDEPEDVLFNSLYNLRSIELNRPAKYNALNGSMIRKIAPRLLEWERSDMANVIVIKGSGEKAFCAGGDVAALAKQNAQGPEGIKKSVDYFGLEYKLNHLIATYTRPYVAFLDGFTMGGGVGLSIHAPFRIATEKTVFAMPETKIGFFPDVGASFFLPRMPGQVGTYLGLTSAILEGVQVYYAGIATHYLHSSSLPALESRLAELTPKDYWTMDQRLSVINDTIEEFSTGLPWNQPIQIGGAVRDAIDRCFKYDKIDEIIAALKEEAAQPSVQVWAKRTLEELTKRSPTSLHVTLRQMRLGKTWDIAQTFKREHQMAAKFMKSHDFNAGVKALLIEKEKNGPAKWNPASLDEIAPGANISEDYFKNDPETPLLELLNDRSYEQYPYNKFGLPNDHDVQELVTKGNFTKEKLLAHFTETKRGKEGLQLAVVDVLRRKCEVEKGSEYIKWKE
ncbi:ClpP/crotonase-like domain-containing protein [Sordaria brevicollis]|uniref:3-hydroxyisobutyryl-CoA hydrolase n=1 Tax=Sordaria brevicollis TaxID=83679 RepID=A0AAE0PPD2_SORBR|nr:ClpP/crotonase-like domain-containing protein [Sordaria brevicollis]